MKKVIALSLVLLFVPSGVTLGPLASAQAGDQGTPPTSMTRAEALEGLHEVPTDRPDYPELGVARYLALSLLQQESIDPSDVDGAARTLVALEGMNALLNTSAPTDFRQAEALLEEEFRPVNETINRIDGASTETWRTVRLLLTSAIQRWGSALGTTVLDLAEEAGENQEIQTQLEGFHLAGEVFLTVGKPDRAAAAKAQREILQTRFDSNMERAGDIHSRVEDLSKNPPSPLNLVGSILWYEASGEIIEDVSKAGSIYNVYGFEEDRSDILEARAELAEARADVRSSLVSILLPIHLALAGLSAVTIHVVQRWERDVHDVMLGTEIALLRGMQG